MILVSRLTAIASVAVAQLRHDRTRTLLAVIGVTLAILSTMLLAGTGLGVVETGQEKFENAGRDLWITGGSVQFTPSQVGGVQNSIYDAHTFADELRQRDSIRTVGPLLFQTVYVSSDGEEFQTIASMGVPSSAGVSISEGRGFQGDSHYANGSYNGPMTHEILIDERTATLLDVDVGDRIHVGGTITSARNNEFTIVGVSSTGNQFLGTPTVTMPLSELQEITGKTGTDPATIVAVTTTNDSNPQAVAQDLQTAYPELTIRTNQEQFQATLERQAVVLAGGASLIVLAVVAGLTLTLNILLSMVYQQLPQYAALKALGNSSITVTGVVITQAIIVGILGCVVSLGLVIPMANGIDHLATTITGFENVVRISPQILLLGIGVAATMSLLSGLIAGSRLVGLDSIRILRNQ
ncbi:putative ABC transport system permease protein [Halopenitus malekzadehii]|uniref:Putative ABC transport system permease protein n=1 Tax=Halopenitus malekzadehii TaxID=1267564 RepID=A0A1H6ICW3_9EURY|nr:ABC transporter permease [Halopenitus malekzadehii]SEH45657.1 putative ABC transport system permease protein [Halopenitus malekzadehii]